MIGLGGLLTLAVGCPTPTEPAGLDAGIVEADRWLGVDRAATFRAHLAHLASVAVSPEAGLDRLGTSWAVELAFAERRYAEAVSRVDAWYALRALVNSLHDGHAYLVASALEPQAPEVALPLSVRVEYEDGGVRYVVRDGGAVAPGSEVLSVDGVPAQAWERERRPWFAGGNSPEALREDVARWLVRRDPRREPAPAPGAPVTLVARGTDGLEREVRLTWAPLTPAQPDCPPWAQLCGPDADGDYASAPTFEGLGACVYATGDPSTRVVRYHTLTTPETYDSAERTCLERKLPRLSYALTLDEADQSGPRGLLMRDQGELLDHLARAGVRRVLFDVRENRGGDFDPVFFGAFTAGGYAQPLKRFVYGHFFQADPSRVARANVYVALLSGEPLPDGAARIEAFLRENPSAARSPPVPFYCQTRACAEAEARLSSQSNLVFRAALLTGPRCFSACDDFVAIFRDNGLAPTVGQPTGAGDSPYSFDTSLPLADGSAAKVHLTVGVSFHPGSNDVPLEAHPVVVDVPVPPSAANRGGYVAAALARVPW